MNAHLTDVLQTNQYWYRDNQGNLHAVFSVSLGIAKQYAAAKGFNLEATETPNTFSPVTIHNATQWYERILLGNM